MEEGLRSLREAIAAAKGADVSGSVSNTSNANDTKVNIMEGLRSLREVTADAGGDNPNFVDDNATKGANPLGAYDLWKPKPRDECAICLRPLPLVEEESVHKGCCGQKMCGGCVVAARQVLIKTNQKRKDNGQPKLPDLCAYCREPAPVGDAPLVCQWEERMEQGDATAYYSMGLAFQNGQCGKPKRPKKAFSLLLRSADLGCPEACVRVAAIYDLGDKGVEKDSALATKYFVLAAKGGNVVARHVLASIEVTTTLNLHRGIKHLKIAAEHGYKESLDKLVLMKEDGVIGKDECNETARAYYNAVNEMKSEERDNPMALGDLKVAMDCLDAIELVDDAKKAKNSPKANNKKGGKKGKKKNRK